MHHWATILIVLVLDYRAEALTMQSTGRRLTRFSSTKTKSWVSQGRLDQRITLKLCNTSGNVAHQESFVSASGFYERALKKAQFVAAPMVAQSDYAFREMCRRHGVQCAFTQMYHAGNFSRCKAFRKAHLDIYPAYEFPSNVISQREAPPPIERGPLVAQIAGHDPAKMLKAAKLILDETEGNVHGIDVNLGCPQSIARKGRYGAYLLRDLDTVVKVLSTLRQELPNQVGVTAKIRIPDYDDANGTHLKSAVHRLCGEAKIDLLTIHGRTLMENKTAVRRADWDKIKLAVNLANEYCVPVLANGGIETFADVQQCLDYTGAQGVMSSEALLENPGLFVDVTYGSRSAKQWMERQFGFALEYLELELQYPPVHGSLGTFYGSHHVVKSHIFKFLHRYLKEHPDLREDLGRPSTCTIAQTLQVVQQLHNRYLQMPDDAWDELESSNYPHSSWYRRHRPQATTKIHTRKVDKLMESQGTKESELLLSTEARKAHLRERIERIREERQKRQADVTGKVFSGLS